MPLPQPPPPLLARRTPSVSLTIEQVLISLLFNPNYTGKSYELNIKDGAINATDLSKIKDEKGEVTRSYDPAYMNTVACVN
jgi:hypothetical protein